MLLRQETLEKVLSPLEPELSHIKSRWHHGRAPGATYARGKACVNPALLNPPLQYLNDPTPRMSTSSFPNLLPRTQSESQAHFSHQYLPKMKFLNVCALAVAASIVIHSSAVDAQDARNASDFVAGVGAPVNDDDSGSDSVDVPLLTVSGASMSGMDMDDSGSTDSSDATSGSTGTKSNTVTTTPAPSSTTSSAVHAGVVGSVVTLAVTAAGALAL
ncbi:hypothetical protein FI667_g9057, partial [Globisporangium splendens]